jgi:hypothetical protein
MFGVIGEAVDANFFFAVVCIQAVEESAVEEGDLLKAFKEVFFILNKTAITVEALLEIAVVYVAILFSIFDKDSTFGVIFFHWGIERGEKEVLENGFVVGAVGFIGVVKQFIEIGFIEEFLGHEFFFLS